MRTKFTLTPAQQQYFVDRLLPTIERYAKSTWRKWRGEKEDWIQDVLANGWEGYVACLRNGKAYTPGTIGWYAVAHALVDRRVGNRPGRSVEGRKARAAGIRRVSPQTALVKILQAEHVPHIAHERHLTPQQALEALVDPHQDPAAIVQYRLDVPLWIASLSAALRKTVRALLNAPRGMRYQDIARRLGISPARLSQRRRELFTRWQSFMGGK